MPRSLSDSFFGSIALKNKMLTRDQLTQALRVQWERTHDRVAPGPSVGTVGWGGGGPTLGEVCRLLGFLSQDQVEAILWAQAKSEVMLEDSLTGQICLKNRLLTRAQLEEALEDQRALDHTVRLGDLLCSKGFIDRQQLHAVLKAQTRLKSGRLKPVIVPPDKPKVAAPAASPEPVKKAAAGPAAKPAKRRKVARRKR